MLRNNMKNSSNFILLIIFLFQIQCMAQSTECATDYIHNKLMKTDSAYRKQIHFLESQVEVSIQNNLNIKLKSTIYNIPVVVHVIHLGEPIGTGSNISTAQIQGAINGLNDRFKNIIGTGLDIGIDFCLAVRDPNGYPTTGINRVNGTVLPNYQTLGIKYGDDTTCIGPNDPTVKDLSKWSVFDYYNIWVVNKICPSYIGGYAYYPWGADYDGTVINYNEMTEAGVILTHEVGHGFNLQHTFNGDGNNFCPIDTNCLVDGDYLCDTPPHKQSDCGSSNPCTDNGIWDNSRYNYMSYCFPSQANGRFTSEGKDRMQATMLVYPRASLANSLGCGTLGINESISNNVLSIYPNPANNQINVKTDVKLLGSVYIVYDNAGKSVLSGKINSENTVIELGNLSDGIYLFSVGDNLKQIFKIIKE